MPHHDPLTCLGLDSTLIPCSTEPVRCEEQMANLTIAIDDEVLRKARIRALEQGTSVNALLREYLITFVADDHIHAIVNGIVEHADTTDAGSGAEGRTWTREELHER